MNTEHASVKKMWSDYLGSIGEFQETTDLTYQSWYFCDNEQDANELVELVLEGTKQGTASLHRLYELENERVPEPGDHSVLTDWDGNAKCIIRDIKVTIIPFREFSEGLALIEGEGDKSLEYWRRAHLKVFKADAEAAGFEFTEDLLVVFEQFEVIYR